MYPETGITLRPARVDRVGQRSNRIFSIFALVFLSSMAAFGFALGVIEYRVDTAWNTWRGPDGYQFRIVIEALPFVSVVLAAFSSIGLLLHHCLGKSGLSTRWFCALVVLLGISGIGVSAVAYYGGWRFAPHLRVIYTQPGKSIGMTVMPP
jgi:hypothetical protein